MIKKLVLTALAGLYIFTCHAQDDAIKGKLFNYYVGVQANQLIKEIINLNNSSAELNNPYLLIFSVGVPKCGWYINGGFGYTYQDITDALSANAPEFKTNNISYRIGIGRRSMISKRFEVGYGADYVGTFQLNKAFTSSITNFGSGEDSTIATTETKTTGYGFGLQLTLGFHITEKIILCTEATYTYLISEPKENTGLITYFIDFNDPTQNTKTFSSTNSDHKQKAFTITLPVALFLVIKF